MGGRDCCFSILGKASNILAHSEIGASGAEAGMMDTKETSLSEADRQHRAMENDPKYVVRDSFARERLETMDRNEQLKYAYKNASNGENETTYVQKADGKFYKVVNGHETLSEEGADQFSHYNYKLGKYGDTIESMLQKNGDYFVLGEKGLGSNQVLKNGDVYDDRITVVMKDNNGQIVIKEFNRANLESTVFDPRTGATNNYNTLTGGKYDVKTGLWSGKTINYQHGGGDESYFILRFTSDTYSTKGVQMTGVLGHAGGPESWDYSHGCQTINRNDYQQFANMFGRTFNAQGNATSYYNNKSGAYYLFR
jgi:hypothetical protein